MEKQNKTGEVEKDKVLAQLERMLENTSENSRQPILDLINKRKVELGLLKSELPHAGYKLKKRNQPKTKQQLKESKPESNESKDSLRKIAMGVGKISETKEIPHDIDVKDEPLKKNKKPIEEVDSYKF